jgi:hypothetical protein
MPASPLPARTACPGETWRTVGTLHGGDAANPMLKTVTGACHHCVDRRDRHPGRAYEKDPITGIVRHLDDHRTVASTLTCPYRCSTTACGIVRK